MAVESKTDPLLTMSPNRLASIAFHVVGIQTEGGSTPYTGPANAGGASGISIGVMQHDFGQSKSLTLSYAEAIVNWHSENGSTLSITPAAIAAALGAPPKSGLLTSEIRSAISSFGAASQGADWIFRNFYQGHVNTAVLAAQRAFATPYGQAVLSEETHAEEFAAFVMKIRNQYGAGTEGGNGAVKSPGFGALMDYLKEGTVKLFDSQHPGQTITVVASHPEEFNRQDLLGFARAYTDTRKSLNEAVYNGPVSALNSGSLYNAILDSDSPLSDVLKRVEAKGNFSPTLIATDPDVALARAMFGTDTGRMKSAVAAINDATTLDPVSVSVTLGQYPGTLWIEPLSGRIALSYKNSNSGFVVSANGYVKFADSAVVKDDNVRTLQIGEGETAVTFDQVATPLANATLPRVAPLATAPVVSVPSPVPSNNAPANPSSAGPASSVNHATTGAIYLSRDGASATLPDGRVINAGPGDKLELDGDGNLSVTRSVSGYKPEDAVYSVSLYERSGQVVAGTQIQIVADPAHPNDPAYSTTVVQGQEREITQIQPDGSSTTVRTVFQTGFGWIEQATGEVVQTVAEWAQERSALNAVPRSESPRADTDAQSIFRRLELQQKNGPKDDAVTSLRTLSPDELRAFETGLAQAAAEVPGTNYADASGYSGNITATDAGGGSAQQAQAQQLLQAKTEASQAASAVSLMNSIIGLQHWDNMSDLQRTAVIASIYNVADKFSKDALPGDLGATASALGLLNALDKGDAGGMLVSGVSLINAIADNKASEVIGNALGINTADVVPGIGLVLAIESGNPMSIMAAAANFIPIYGQFISVALSVLGDAFGDDAPDIPMREGLAHAEWDAAGNTVVVTDQDVEGGGSTATAWMSSMVDRLQAQLAGVHDEAGNSYALVPNLLPAIGFQYDPDGFDLGNGGRGFVYLKWTDENGESQTRYYDGTGSRNDGTGETLAGDFMQHAFGAIAPAWQVQTVLAHYQRGLGIELPRAEASLPQVLADGLHQATQVITLALPVELALQDTLIDVDGDGYLERTQWLAENQQVLAVDADGNEEISTGELLSLDCLASRNSLRWLDANSDDILDARDPAFSALRLWLDVSSDADSHGETQTMAQAGISAIDFGSNPPAILHLDGSRTVLTIQSLNADVLGVQYQAVEGGVLQLDEQASGPVAATLHAVNTRGFDGQAGYVHGGTADTDGGEASVDAGDGRLVAASASAIATQSARTETVLGVGDARIRVGTSGNTQAGQSAAPAAGTVLVRNSGVVFVPPGFTSVGAQLREAAEDMVRGADAGSFAPLGVLAIGAASVQWPAVATAAPLMLDARAATSVAPTGQTPIEHVDWLIWEGARTSGAAPAGAAPELRQVPTVVNWSSKVGPANTIANVDVALEPPVPLEWASPISALSVNAMDGSVSPSAPATYGGDDAVADSLMAPFALANTLLDYPEIHGEQASGLEDSRLHFLETLLLSNDRTVNALAHPGELGLHISSVFAPEHGSVSMQTNAQGLTEVVFLPDADYHGLASFGYTVTDQYGLSSNARVGLKIGAVNDAPVTQDSHMSSGEDVVLHFAPADLLTSASDVDMITDGQQLSIAGVVAARHGVAALMPDGRIRFTPDADYNQSIDGLASFTYGVSDGAGDVTLATVWLSLASVNDAPRLQDEFTHALEDQVLRIDPADLMSNDSDVDNLHADLRISAVGDPTHGSVALQVRPGGGNLIVFTPEANYHGVASFRYTVTDPEGGSTAATAQVVLTAVNDVPVAQDGHLSSAEDTVLDFASADLLAGASDADIATDGQQLSISTIAEARHGAAVLMPDGRVRFTPDANYNQSIDGLASFTYNVSDGTGGETSATVWVSLVPVNDAPRLLGETANALEDQVLSIAAADLLANDMDVDNLHAELHVSAVGDAVHGSVALLVQPDGSSRIVFTPEADYHGIASFRYTVTDPDGANSMASAQIALSAVNDAPVTQDETVVGSEDTALLFTAASLLANDFDADTVLDGDVLRITRVGMAEHGQAFLQPDGTVRFEPDADYNGPAKFNYWVGDRDAAQITVGEGNETEATVNLTILAVNDLPVVKGESINSDEDVVLNINPALLLANDTDVDAITTNGEPAQVLSISAVGGAQHGNIALLADGTLQFTPDPNYFGTAGFSYTVDDGRDGLVQGQVVLNLAPLNDAPDVLGEIVTFNEDEIQTLAQDQLLANDSDVDNSHGDLCVVSVENATHGTVLLNADGTIRFVPEADYFGAAQFTYNVADGAGGFTAGLASLDIATANDAPRLMGEAVTLDEDTQARFAPDALLENDGDVDNPHADLQITAVSNAGHGNAQIVAGEIVFTPDLNYSGTASFDYTVSDGAGGTSLATVNLTLNPINDTPVANSELVWGKQGVSYTLTQAALLANDTDAESPAALHVSAISNVQHGSAVLSADGSVRFVPLAGDTGRGGFDYVVQDPDGGAATATALIDFSRVNINPVATDDGFIGYEDTPFNITQAQLLINDSDADNPISDLRVTAVGSASNGTVSLQADGSVRFVAAADFYGAASFAYLLSDGDGGQAWATARLSVQPVNDAPVIDEIIFGRPVYGYLPGAVATQDVAIYDEAQGLALANTGFLYSRTYRGISSDSDGYGAPAYDYAMVNPTYYRNGQMRPVFIENVDATYQDPNNYEKWMYPGDGTRPVDDPYRQNGYIVAYDPDGDSAAINYAIASTPQHGHAWANQFTAHSTPRDYSHTVAQWYAVAQTGAWQYYSQRGDPYSGADPFTIAVTDGSGATSYLTINTAQVGSIAPVALDLDGGGLQYLGLDKSKASFDVDQTGERQYLAWVAPGDALLARDIGGDRTIDRSDEIAFTGYLPGANTDLEGLAAFDSNTNQRLDPGDTNWREFGVWQDKNSNGISDAGEFCGLDEVGIAQIDLQSDRQTRQPAQGVTEVGRSSFTWTDGRTAAVGDVMLAVRGDHLPASSPAMSVDAPVLPTPEHMALLMVQVISTATAEWEAMRGDGSLACIETSNLQDVHQSLMAAQAEWMQASQIQAVQLHGVAS